MALRTPTCPSCTSQLTLTSKDELDTWNCNEGHGLGMVMHEAYGILQDDEIQQIWDQTKSSTQQSPRACPICERAMLAIEVAYDADEILEGTEHDGENEGSVWLDVCDPCQLIWFDSGELELLPTDLENAAPSPQVLEMESQVRAAFSESYMSAVRSRTEDGFTERVYNAVLNREPQTGLISRLRRR